MTSAGSTAPVLARFGPRADELRRRILRPWSFRLYLLGRVPLAAAAGLRLVRLDERECVVGLPGGWRTRNPFGSAYFAAQTMAAEMSTGAPAMVLVRSAPVSVAFILREIRAVFSKRVTGPSTYTCADVAGLAAAVESAAATPEPVSFVARCFGRSGDGSLCSEFEVAWSFKRR